MSLKNKVNFIKNYKAFPQKSPEWYLERFNSITATDVAPILESNPYYKKIDILKKKLDKSLMIEEIDSENLNLIWGNKYEPVAKIIYEEFVHDTVYDVGLIKHRKYKWLGASPDGIRDCGKLLEIKCVWNRKIKNKTPFYYWIQVQIQLEVCDLNECDFFQCKFLEYDDFLDYSKNDGYRKGEVEYDGQKSYWKLIEHSCESIKRDKEWFAKVFPIIKEFHETILYYRKMGNSELEKDMNNNLKRKALVLSQDELDISVVSKKPKLYLTDWSNWIHSNEIRNYILNDTLLDWLDMYGSKYQHLQDRQSGLNDYLQGKDAVFRDAVEDNLGRRFGKFYYKVADSCHLYSTEKVSETFQMIQEGMPIICKPVLHNKNNKTICQPDFIVRSDYLTSIVREDLNWKDVYPLHYVVLDLRYLSLHLKGNGEIYNSGNINYYKCKMWMETQALNQLQSIPAKYGFMLGRKYKINQGKVEPMIYYNNCFATLGMVSLEDSNLKIKIEGALEWVSKLKLQGKDWKISPPSNSALYPNMSNASDYPWTSLKQALAHKNKEITLINGLGVKDRRILMESKIDRWDKINLDLLKISQGKRVQISRILEVNKPYGRTKMLPKKVVMGDKYRGGEGINFYVDFESINDHYDDFNKIRTYRHQHPKMSEIYSGIIFLIGIGYIHPENGEWIFKSLVVDRVDYDNEKLVLRQFSDYIQAVRDEFNVKDKHKSYLYHWSNAERSSYIRLMKKYNMSSLECIEWVDLMDVFKSNPIGIRGVFNYGLKNVAKKMYEYGMIHVNWVDGDQNGLSAMIAATHCHNSQNQTSKLSQMSGLQVILDYNEVDCRVMWEIQKYLLSLI